MNNFVYLDIELKLRDDTDAVLTPAYIQGSIETSLVEFFGEIGGQSELELVKFDGAQKRAILKVPLEFSHQTKAAISLIGHFQNIPCHFEILKTSKEPLSL